MHNFTLPQPRNTFAKIVLYTCVLFFFGFSVQAQIGVQSPSIGNGVTFQWEDSQTINGNFNNDNPATIKSITINGTLFNTFAVPTGYQLTRLGPAGHGPNQIVNNGSYSSFNSSSATQNINDSNAWDNAAKAAFQSKNLNRYFTSNPNGRSICLDFNKANGINGQTETDAQLQTLFYDPPLPANAGGVLAVTERGGNNCFYVRLFGFLPGSTTETPLGDTFVRTNNDMYGGNFSEPVSGSDYWGSGREQDNGQTIAIALFQLDNVAPVGSKITRVRFVAASTDHGDGKVFILQRYAQPQIDMGCVDGTFNGQIDNSSTVPAGSTYTLISGPSPAGTSFTFNTDGSYQYVPTPGYIGDVTFTYKVRLPEPNNNITDTNTVALTYNPNPPDPVIDVDCNANGSYNISVTTPIGANFEYQINNQPYQSSPNFNNLGAGTYVFSVRDLATGCENKPSSTSVTLETLTASLVNVSDVDCFGDDDGAIDIAVEGGFPPYSYVWSNGATTQDVSNLAPGNYNVQISDSSGCVHEFINDIVVNGPTTGISVTRTITHVLCFGAATGAIDITVSGGTPGYTFSWSNGETTEDISGLVAGDYTVVVTDANGCTFEKTYKVVQPGSGMTLTSTKEDILCNGGATGSIDLMVAGGAPPYTYSWTNGSSTQDLSGLVAGNYNVTVTDDNGCTASLAAPVVILQPEALSIELTKTNANATALCANGTATATVTGGTGAYTYLWDDPLAQTTATATGLSGNFLGGITYTVLVTDENGCEAEQSVIITCVQDCDAVISVGNVINVLCKGGDTGSASVQASSVANPSATFTYTWNTTPPQIDAGVLAGTPSTISGQTAGVYTVSVTIDGTLCQPVEESVTITEPTTAVSVTATATDETGPTTNDGTATANPSGGIPPYTYLWSPGGETTQTITGLSDGTYSVTVTDANGCMASTEVTVNNGDCNNLSATASSTPVSCNGFSDGTATVNVTGGLGNFTYSWSPGGQTTQTITDLSQGVYTVTVTDVDTQCTATSTTTVNEPTALTSGIAVTNIACFGDSTGSLDLTVSGGTTPYTYVWSNGANTEDISNLAAGTYSVTITDANGCFITDEAEVLQPAAALEASITSQTDILCATSLGSVTVTATGGTPTYSYNLDGGPAQASGTFTGLTAGSFTVNVIDANGCTTPVSVTILENCTIAVNDFRDTVVNIPINGNVLTNDEDMEGDDQVVTTLTVTSDQGVVVNIAPDGSYTYTPPMNYIGGDFFMYSIEDNGDPQATDSATVFIRIHPIDQNNTIANADAYFTEIDLAISGNVLTNDVDIEGDAQTVINPGTYNLPGGVLVLNSNGTFVYTPNPGFTGTDTFTYEIIDDNALPATDTAVLTITVIGGPNMNYTFAVDDGYGGNQGATITGNVLDNDFDPEGDTQTVDVAISPVSGPTNGSLTINPDGTFSYTPNNPSFFGNDSFVYEIFDNGTPEARDQATVSIIIVGENTILAVDDINNTYVGLPVNGTVATNDENYDGPVGTETFSLVSGPTAGGTLTFNPDGTYNYTPPANPLISEDTFVYQICDAGNPVVCDTATVYIEILPIPNTGNEPPVANADTNTTEVNTPVTGQALPNDFDPDGDSITVTGNTNPANGSVTIDANGTYTYTPNSGFTGEDSFEYTICDDQNPALCDTTTVTIQVIADEGNITVANDDAYNGIVDTVISGNVLDNDTDPEDNDQTVDVAVTPVSGPANGALVMNPNGTFTYTPTAGFVGTDQFIYEIFDNGTPLVARDQATVYLTVGNGVNVILAIDDINDTFVNLPVDGDVGTNDLNEDGPAGTETFTLVTGPINGTLTFNPDGTYRYEPGLDYVGEDTFKYQVCDGGNPVACDTATVYIEVQPLGSPDNDPPVANADTNSTQIDTPVDGNVLPNDYDPDGDPITVTDNTNPDNGSVTVNPDGTYTYTPDQGFTGEDTFEYTICDNQTPALCDTATVTIQVLDTTENITTAVDDAYYGFPDTDITGNVLDNDTDPESNDQTVDVTVSPGNGPNNGTVALNTDGTFTYTPGAGFEGTDSFVYEIFDNGNPVATDVATVYISIASGGNEILAIDDINDTFVNLPVDGDVGTNDLNEDGPAGTETFTLVTGTINGTLTFNPDGTYTYEPGLDFVGEDTFIYQVCDGGNPVACDTATVYIEVQPLGSPGNEPPVANADTNSTQINTPVDGTVLPNDYDPDGDPIVVTGNTDPANGDVTVNPDGTYTYTPDPGFTGEDTFEYTICDNQTPALCDTATVTIQVLDTTENITTAVDDAYYGFPDADITGNVLDNDTDPESNNQTVDVTVSPGNGPSNGTVALNADGTFTYTPGAGFEGTDSFVYEIFDNGNPVAIDVATVYISIASGGNEILAVDDINDTFVNLPVSGSVATNDENYDGPTGTEVFTLISGPTAGGTLTFNPDGTYDYTPPADYVGDDTFIYQVCDGGNPVACDTATVTITVVDDPIIGNDPPVAINDVNITEINVPVDGNVLVNDFDPDEGDTILVTANTDPTNGTVTIAPNGDYTYTPNQGFEGVDTFEYTICDSATPALCDTAIVTIYVIGDPGNITVANDDAYYGEIDATVTGNVLDNDNDPELDSQILNVGITPVSGPSNGSVTVNPNGSFEYTPDVGFTGNDQFVYEIFDNGGPVATDQATVYILIAQTPAPAIAIVKSGVFIDGNNDNCADVGEIIRYTFEVTNEGNVPLGAVLVTDPLLEAPNPVVAITFVDGDTNGNNLLDVDETWTYTADYAMTQDDIDLGTITNQATVEGTDEDGTTVDDLSDEALTTEDDPTVTDLCQSPVIAIVKTGLFVDGDGDQCADPGEAIDYTFTVTNEGNVSLSTISVTDPLLEAPNPVVAIVFAGGDTDGDNELDVTETWTYTASYAITQDDIDAGEVVNQATAEGTAPDATVVDDLSDEVSVTGDTPTTTDLCQSPVIAIVKTGLFVDGDGDQCADPGEAIDYTFTVTNEGNVSLSDVSVTDPLLEAPNPVVAIVFAGGDTDGDTELDVDETWTYTASYAITQDDIDAGEVVNQATAEGTAPDATVVDDLSDEVSVTGDTPTTTDLCQSPVIALIKIGTLNDENGNGCTDVGETISYAFEVMNTGNVTLVNVDIDDPLVNVVGGLITLAPGETNTTNFTAVYSITQVDIDNGSFTNQATAMGEAPDGTIVEDLSDESLFTEDDPTITILCQNASIALIKMGTVMDENGSGCADPKETIDYTFTVMNTGNVTLTNIDIQDPLVNVQGGPITLVPGQTDLNSFTATYLITQANINDGFVENQAVVSGLDPESNTVSDASDDNSFLEDDPTITPLCQGAAIALIKTADPQDQNGNGCVELGESIMYEFVVKNTGNVVLTNITITDPLVAVTGGPITLNPLDSDSNTFRAEYFLTQEDVDNGFVINQATAEGTAPDGTVVMDASDDDSFDEDEPTEVGLCQDPRVSLEKEGIFNDNNGDGVPQPDETITYIFSVRNTGDVTLYNLTLEDDDLDGIIITGDPIPELLPGEVDETTYTAVYAINQEDIDNGEVLNQAIIRGTTLDGTEVEDTSDDPNDLTNVDPDGDGDPDDPTVVILPNVLPASPFEIFNGITPDADGLNDFFRVVGIEDYGPNNMKIFNRWGVQVWETDNYGGLTGEENVFDGYSNGRSTIRDSELLPTGTYFYVLTFTTDDNPGESNYTGYLYINR